MMEPKDIQDIVARRFPGAEVNVRDLTGAKDHFQVYVAWKEFLGKGLLEQHQAVNKVLQPYLENGRIHALSIRTITLDA